MAAASGIDTDTSKLTWKHQPELPSLPVPTLADTMRRYLRSCEPLYSADELAHTKAVVSDFLKTSGPELQALLEDKAATERNWIEEWWEKYAYLVWREPIAVNINFYGVLPGTWGAYELSQAQSTALMTYFLLKFRSSVLDGTLEPETMAGQPLCMAQYRRMFSVIREPGEHEDELVEWDPHAYKHVVVLVNNRFFAFDVLDSSDAIMGLDDLTTQIQRVIEDSACIFEQDRPTPLSKLTGGNRTKWAKARAHLKELDPQNEKSLEIVERAILHISLDQASPESLADRAKVALHGDGCNKWFDKPLTLVQFKNGKGGSNGEHTWADAMVIVKAFDVAMDMVMEHLKTNKPPRMPTAADLASAALPRPTERVFKLDSHMIGAVEEASADLAELISTVDLDVLEFEHFGKDFFRRYRLMADSVCQMAIQLAYSRLHPGDVAPTYESAHTRLFYRGRTETIRTTCNESVAFCSAMNDGKASAKEKFEALQGAMKAHRDIAKDALMAQGVDRHMLGLYIVAQMSGADPLPSIFSDKAFKGSRYYKLSTSNISMKSSPMFGGFMAMYPDGYGICYCIRNESLKFSITANNTDSSTSASKMRVALEKALVDIQRLCLTRSVIYVTGGSSSKL